MSVVSSTLSSARPPALREERHFALVDGFALFLKSRHAVDSFFQGTRDRDHHLVDRHHAVVHTDQNSGKVRCRKYVDRDGEGEVTAHQAERDDQENDRSSVTLEPVRRVPAVVCWFKVFHRLWSLTLSLRWAWRLLFLALPALRQRPSPCPADHRLRRSRRAGLLSARL